MWLLGIIAVIIVIYIVSTFNYFKDTHELIQQEKSGIDVALTTRFDTLTKMRDVVKSYTKHENTTFVEVTKVRKGMSVGELSQAESQMQNAFGQMSAIAESYPELKVNDTFVNLQKAIMNTEDNLQAARGAYNATVANYNSHVTMFPSCLIASLAKAQRVEFFEAEASKREDVDMNF